jgi:hypothetical protein
MKEEQDLRKLFLEERKKPGFKLKPDHKDRFFDVLENQMPKKRKSTILVYKIVASFLLLIVGAVCFYQFSNTFDADVTPMVNVESQKNKVKEISLGDLSPDLRKIEKYYVTNINLELSRLEMSSKNKSLVDSYLGRLLDLNTEYKLLNEELNTIGPNDQTITALIKNLQLRLKLLQKLKVKLIELKTSKNETAIKI